jgi:hypothetical protein
MFRPNIQWAASRYAKTKDYARSTASGGVNVSCVEEFMKKRRRIAVTLFAALFVTVGTAWTQSKGQSKTDAEIRQEIIASSIAAYHGSCPCPYNTDRAGRRCGGRSAYNKAGGAAPLCYESDVTQKMVDEYRRRNK